MDFRFFYAIATQKIKFFSKNPITRKAAKPYSASDSATLQFPALHIDLAAFIEPYYKGASAFICCH
jgi:hypothetical protein